MPPAISPIVNLQLRLVFILLFITSRCYLISEWDDSRRQEILHISYTINFSNSSFNLDTQLATSLRLVPFSFDDQAKDMHKLCQSILVLRHLDHAFTEDYKITFDIHLAIPDHPVQHSCEPDSSSPSWELPSLELPSGDSQEGSFLPIWLSANQGTQTFWTLSSLMVWWYNWADLNCVKWCSQRFHDVKHPHTDISVVALKLHNHLWYNSCVGTVVGGSVAMQGTSEVGIICWHALSQALRENHNSWM